MYLSFSKIHVSSLNSYTWIPTIKQKEGKKEENERGKEGGRKEGSCKQLSLSIMGNASPLLPFLISSSQPATLSFKSQYGLWNPPSHEFCSWLCELSLFISNFYFILEYSWFPWRRAWQFMPGFPMHRGAWQATVHGVTKKSDMAERLSTRFTSLC